MSTQHGARPTFQYERPLLTLNGRSGGGRSFGAWWVDWVRVSRRERGYPCPSEHSGSQDEAVYGEGHVRTLHPRSKTRGFWEQNAQDYPGVK